MSNIPMRFYQCLSCLHIQLNLSNCNFCKRSLMIHLSCTDDSGLLEIEDININVESSVDIIDTLDLKKTVQSQKAYQCTQCGFINYVLCHCPRCNTYILSEILIIKPVGFYEV